MTDSLSTDNEPTTIEVNKSNSYRYLELGDLIKELEAERKEIQGKLAKNLPVGAQTSYNGAIYEWVGYDRSAKSWKDLFKSAYTLLDDEGQVIVGEQEAKATKVTHHYKFEKRSL